MMWTALAIFSFFCLFVIYLYRPNPRIRKTKLCTNHYAHRGLYDHGSGIPENSMMAFRRAKHQGYGCELDVQCTKDGKLVVFHDDDLKRMTGVEGLVSQLKYSELENLRLLGTNERIPLFKEVLDLELKELLIEIKGTQARQRVVLALLKDLKSYKGQFSVCSFDPLILIELKRHAPMIHRGLIMEDPWLNSKHSLLIKLVLSLGIFVPLIRLDYLSKDIKYNVWFYQLFRLLKGRTTVWTVKSIEAEHQVKHEVDGIIFENYLPYDKVN